MLLTNNITIIERKKLGDARGWFMKVIDGHEKNLPKHTGEIYLTHASGKGQIRGNHYHDKATEWFILLQGQCELRLMDMNTKEMLNLQLDADEPKTIVIPPNIAHAFNNTQEEPFLLLAYTDELYNPVDTIAVQLY
ncbi:MAG: dTDP-4-dehydrorhamnose 3,5-epimerase [uncultured Sulfurovum sp.]|uniref:dTDP-4-dehydrorhamnose 3,5-epimerase n=1 Tax=uncultured Sulfurovum sp. TaxID=269237 RepID=A0A6S6TK65_9BACT|nr:MAG: dTDP-4-dehydrorhamnose 3,5-epimerase [uncultured Sulfurovum sp.]